MIMYLNLAETTVKTNEYLGHVTGIVVHVKSFKINFFTLLGY